MNQRQPESDGEGCEPVGARLSVAPRMMIRNMKVITTSLTSAASSE